MKSVLLVLISLFSFNLVLAQSIDPIAIKAQYWGASNTFFKSTTIPAKWEKESAVIIAQEFKHDYDKVMGGKVHYVESFQRRIKLLDKAAVKEFSEFSFDNEFKGRRGYRRTRGKMAVGFKVIKADGTEKEIDLAQAVAVEGEGKKDEYKKIAIPDLVEGDIIDYYYYVIERFDMDNFYSFRPVITTLAKSYPIVNQRLEFQVEKKFYINFKALNGAPTLKRRENKRKKIFTLESKDIEKQVEKRWMYEYRSLPTIKFQVTYARNRYQATTAFAFLGESGISKTEVSKKEIFKFFKPEKFQSPYYASMYVKSFKKYLRRKGLENEADETKLAKEIYYFLRYKLVGTSIEPYIYGNQQRTGVNEYMFVIHVSALLDQYGIENDIVVTIPRHISTIDDLILIDEVSVLLRLNLPKPIYISNFSWHTTYGTLSSSFQGNKAYLIKWEAVDIELPMGKHSDNGTEARYRINFNTTDFNQIKVYRNTAYKGLAKSRVQYDLVKVFDFIDKDHSAYEGETFFDSRKMSKKKKATMVNRIKNYKSEALESREKYVKGIVENDYDAAPKNYEKFEILSMGRNDHDTEFSYEETFDIEGFTKKAGPNYILEFGRLIGGQVEIKEDERQREHDIYMSYPRAFNYEIEVKIPKGYTFQGLEKFNKMVENETGGFVSTAEVRGASLWITAKKYYTTNFVKAEKWPLMLDFLDAAHQFTQEKLLLKKL